VSHEDSILLQLTVLAAINPRDDGPGPLKTDLSHLQLDGLVDLLFPVVSEGSQMVVLSAKLVGSEVVDIEPVIVPGVYLGLTHLPGHGLIGEEGKVAEGYSSAAFDYGLALAKK